MYNLQHIMTRAWTNYRRGSVTFPEALHRAWISEKAIPVNSDRIHRAKLAAGIVEECRTWSDWKSAGFEVVHGSKALFGVDLIYGSRGDGAVYKARFFGRSQVQPVQSA